MTRTEEIVSFLDALLDTAGIKDSSCNGLQVQGPDHVVKIGLAVDASMETYRKAAKANVQMLIVHHGLIWNGVTHITGYTYRHIKYLIDNGINLYVSHLPLDKHPVVGNNFQLAACIGLTDVIPAFGYHGEKIGCCGRLPKALSNTEIANMISEAYGGKAIILPFGKKKNHTVGIVSGAASDMLGEALSLKLDCFLTGEPVHSSHHQAHEGGINVVFGGHYETEKAGVMALGQVIEQKFGIRSIFLDIPTIV